MRISGWKKAAAVIGLAITVVGHLALAVWVGRDARQRGHNGPGWFVGTLIGGVFGVALYRGRRHPVGEMSGPSRGGSLADLEIESSGPDL